MLLHVVRFLKGYIIVRIMTMQLSISARFVLQVQYARRPSPQYKADFNFDLCPPSPSMSRVLLVHARKDSQIRYRDFLTEKHAENRKRKYAE